ncbi:MAG: TetR/AcrR family transcriptional regulator, partial [Bacteroidota bacterium]|nr:TetR/AcrR family transcriptional regulator [Bacteroidota bacterium]
MKKFYSRKDGIILTAIEIISELGFQSLSIREIAKRQGMAESLLYKNYKSKDEVLAAVLKYYSKYDTAIMNTILKNENAWKQKIIDFVCSYAEYYQNYPAITSLPVSYDSFFHEDSSRDLVISIVKKRSEYISYLISNAIEKGELKRDFNPAELSE